jgi:hypothetical protein
MILLVWNLVIKLNGANSGTFFNDTSSINLNDFGYKTGDSVIRLDELHASGPKILLLVIMTNEIVQTVIRHLIMNLVMSLSSPLNLMVLIPGQIRLLWPH